MSTVAERRSDAEWKPQLKAFTVTVVLPPDLLTLSSPDLVTLSSGKAHSSQTKTFCRSYVRFAENKLVGLSRTMNSSRSDCLEAMT